MSCLLPLAALGVAVFCGGCGTDASEPSRVDPASWAYYGGDAGGSRYSSLSQINRDNVERLQIAWTYRTGEMPHEDGGRSAKKNPTCGYAVS